MRATASICTGYAPAPLPRLLPGGECSKGLWIPQGISVEDKVTIALSRLSATSSGTLPRFSTLLLQGDTIKRTFQPKKRYRRRVHGFLRRMSAKGGQRVVQNRRRK